LLFENRKVCCFAPFPFFLRANGANKASYAKENRHENNTCFAENGWKSHAKTEGNNRQKTTPVFETKAWRAGDARLKNCDTAATSHCVPTPTPKNCLQNEPQPRQNYP
jgi:hypothetical protein